MKCMFCGCEESKVIESRETNENSIRRRRECVNCGKRFTTYESVNVLPLMVVKRDGKKEIYSREKMNITTKKYFVNEMYEKHIIKNNELTLEEAYDILNTAIGGDPDTGVPSVLDEFKDRNIYNLKFLTTGGYSNCGYLYNYTDDPEDPEYIEPTERINLGTYKILQSLAEERGDAIALVEYRQIFDSKDQLLKEIDATEPSFYAAAFYP